MRFVITGQWRDNGLLSAVMLWFLLYVALFWLTNLLLFFVHYGLSYEAVVRAYLGSEAEFLAPRSYRGLLEMSHAHLFAMGILILTMTHLLLFVPVGRACKWLVVSLSFSSALGDELSGWLVRYVHPAFAYAKIASFLLLQAALGFLILLVAWVLVCGKAIDNGDASPHGAERQPAGRNAEVGSSRGPS